MREGSERWHEVSESDFAHEREGLAHVRELLPDRGPFHAWSNFEFRDSHGKWHEVDLLVLGEGRLHLVELKHYQGRISGDAYRWQRGSRSEDSPVLLARRKAQRLASVLKDAARDAGVRPDAIPFVQQSVFLHATNTVSLLRLADQTDLFGLDGLEGSTNLPSIVDRLLEAADPGRRVDELAVLEAVKQAGFAVRREREVGTWRLTGEPLAEGDGWQDWPAEHKVTRESARIRFFVPKPGASQGEVAARRHLAQREYTLTARLHQEHVLKPRDIVDDQLGTGLVFPHDPGARRLDLWLADSMATMTLADQVALIRQLAEALHYVHGNHVVHRALNPSAVTVAEGRDGRVDLQVGDWQVAGVTDDADSQLQTGTATRIFGRIGSPTSEPEERLAEVYVAPEGQWVVDLDRVRLDVFALGAVAYLIATGQPPATSAADLRDRLNRDRGLDVVADLPSAPAQLRDLILEATRPGVSDRLRDVGSFLNRLADVERELGDAGSGEVDPLEARPGTLLGSRFELIRRLGSGSTAVGLLVKDSESEDRRVLKVALDDSAARRLREEAEVLAAFARKGHPRLVRLVEPEPLQVGERLALLLESAGEETLSEIMRERRRLSLDLLERWGTDLLEALVALDDAGVDHRDIKPSNLGVREQRSDRAKHLVLFDFSLAKASASTLTAGTPPYLDPFLGVGKRRNWDSAAERYAAAVTLFEMATGHAPVYGDGQSNPAVTDDEAAVEPGAFDPSVAGALTEFFRRALRREASERHHTAAEMLAAWRSALSSETTTVPDDADSIAAAATPETSLAQSGLSARALSALEPFGLATVADLVGLDTSKLSRFSGVVMSTRDEIRRRAKEWRTKFGDQVVQPAEITSVEIAGDPWLDPEGVASILAQAAGGPRATARRDVAARLLGLEGEAPAFATLADLAGPLGLGGQPQVSQTLAKIRDAWADDSNARALLDLVEDRVSDLLDQLDGVAWVDTVVEAASPQDATPRQLRLVAGLIRSALDRGDDKARGADEAPQVHRRRLRGDDRMLLALTPELGEVAHMLAERAEKLVAEAAVLGDVVVPPSRSVPALREVYWQDRGASRLPQLTDVRLVRLAARLSVTVAASSRGELYDRAMPAVDAVRLTLAAVPPSERLTMDDVRSRVAAKLPGLAALPGRPQLDVVLREAGTRLEWTGDAYCVPSQHSDTSLVSMTDVTVIPVGRSTHLADHKDAEQLRQSIRACSFLALGTRDSKLDQMTRLLVDAFGASEVNVTDVLISSMRSQIDGTPLTWDTVLAADAADPHTRDAQGLAALVRRAIPLVEQAVDAALQDAPEATRPVLLTEAAPLARYNQLDLLRRLADITTKRRQAVWLLLPQGGQPGAHLDGVPVPVSHAAQFLALDSALTSALTPSSPEGEPS